MTKVAVIGCGLIGRAWTISFLRGGCEVTLWDMDTKAPERLRAALPETFEGLRAHGLLEGDTESLLSRLTICDTMENALSGVDHVQENTAEVLDVKRDLFAKLDAVAPKDAVLATSTSGLQPSAIFDGLPGRARCLVAHPINPPYLIPAVELVPSPWTRADVMDKTAGFIASLGQSPIVMKKEIDGFLMNRLQGALLDEAFRLVEHGYASAEDVDIGIREGLALRWSFMGPFETIDLNAPDGVRDYVERYAGMYQGVAEALPGRPDWTGPALDKIEAQRRESLPIEDLQNRQNWRDRRLMALAQHKKKAGKEIGT